MDTSKLELFVQLAQLKNITNTAHSLGYTQSGASHMLQSLESELGDIVLFTRSRKGVALTPAGEQLLPLAQELLYWYGQLRQTAGSLQGKETGLLRIAGFTSAMVQWFPVVQKRFGARYPHVQIETMRASYGDVEKWVRTGQADCGFGRLPVRKGLRAYFLAEDPLVAILPAEHPLTEKEILTCADLNGEVFIRPTQDRFADVLPLLKTARITLRFPHIVHDYHEVITTVASGMGVSIVPKMMIQLYTHAVAVRPLLEGPSRKIGLIVRDGNRLPPLTEAFILMTSELFRSGALT